MITYLHSLQEKICVIKQTQEPIKKAASSQVYKIGLASGLHTRFCHSVLYVFSPHQAFQSIKLFTLEEDFKIHMPSVLSVTEATGALFADNHL